VTARLEEAGYAVRTQHVRLPNGSFSHNVVAVKAGVSSRRIVLGAHLDTKGGSPGANDNASGVAVVLELARVLKDVPTQPTIVFAFFGAEEMWDGNADHHHYGSRAYVRGLSFAQKRRISGMISVDMVGFGRFFLVRTMRLGPLVLSNRLRTVAAEGRVRLRYSRDPSKVGWSDHEPFEKAGIPVAWLNWKSDPFYHTPADTAERLQDVSINATGALVERYLTGMTARELRALRR
jgi:aminopeptidase YwaD